MDKNSHLFSSMQNDGSYCYPLGPRLMHTVAMSGFKIPKRLNFIFRISAFDVLVVSLGEIDCRMYLGSRDSKKFKQGDWPELFLQESIKLAQKLDVKHLLILTPVPPSDLALENKDYPRQGNLSSRVSATNWLSDRIISSSIFLDPKHHYLDLRPILAKGDGSLNLNLTDDGVHVNSAGAKAVLESISKMYLFEQKKT
jgi:lysophospholipase L1-like esterase